MQNVNKLLSQRNGSTSTKNSEVETKAVNYLFALLAVIFGEKKMTVTFPDQMLAAAKRMNALAIGKFNREQIDKGIVFIKSEREKGNPDFEWPNIDLIIGSIKEANRVRQLHRVYEPPVALIGHDKEVAAEAGRRTIKELKAMF